MFNSQRIKTKVEAIHENTGGSHMLALTFWPGVADSAELREIEEPSAEDGLYTERGIKGLHG